eukprot:gene5654-7039_t
MLYPVPFYGYITIEPGTLPKSLERLLLALDEITLIPTDPPQQDILPSSVVELEFNNWSPEKAGWTLDYLNPINVSINLKASEYVFTPGYFSKWRSIKSLKFHYSIKNGIELPDGFIPNSIKTLILEGNIQTFSLPNSVEEFYFSNFSDPKIFPILSPNIKILKVNYFRRSPLKLFPCNLVPESITHLYVYSNQTQLDFKNAKNLVHFDFNLKVYPTKNLPPNLQSLKLNLELTIRLVSPSLTKLHFQSTVNIPLVSGILPPTLLKLVFENGISTSTMFPVLPMGLKSLKINKIGTYAIKNLHAIPLNSLPSSLLKLCVNSFDHQTFDKGVLPPNLKSLKINPYTAIPPFPDTLIMNLPNSIEYLRLPRFNDLPMIKEISTIIFNHLL